MLVPACPDTILALLTSPSDRDLPCCRYFLAFVLASISSWSVPQILTLEENFSLKLNLVTEDFSISLSIETHSFSAPIAGGSYRHANTQHTHHISFYSRLPSQPVIPSEATLMSFSSSLPSTVLVHRKQTNSILPIHVFSICFLFSRFLHFIST